MARAARAAFARLLEEMPDPGLVQILCGPGNNGGDGLLLAVLAAARAIDVRVFLVDGEPRSEDARAAAERARAAGLALEAFAPAALEDRGVIVDAMLGTGIRGAPREAYAEAIAAINALNVPVLALDVPSGIDADSAAAPAAAVRATWTISFITAKRGLYTGAGRRHAGALCVDDLDVPRDAFEAAGQEGGSADLLYLDQERAALPERETTAHKGDYGRCLLIGGEHGMGGAIVLAAEAALRSGVGLARVATRDAHLAPLLARRPECMASAVNGRGDLEPLLPWASAVVVGPGLGRSPWSEQMLHAALRCGRPLLLDADALNLLAAAGVGRLPEASVITPHPGEAARLLACDTGEVEADRFAAATALAARTGATVVLKGAGTVLAQGERLAVCPAGNPGMASGGMGDVLSGIIGALLAQGLSPWRAARLGAVLHGGAADRVIARGGGMAGLLAADLAPVLAELLP
jgi:NAD(P)H-hydrate epimerase